MGPHAALAGGVGPQPRVQNGVGDDWLPRFSNGTNFAYFCSYCPTLGGERREETFSQEPMGRACRARPVRPKEAYDAARIGLHRGRDGAGRHGRPRRRHGYAVARLETRGSVERDRAAAEGADRASLTQIIHEGIVTDLDQMTNDQFPMTNRGARKTHTVTVPPDRCICHWSLIIGIWSFPQKSRMVFANNAR